MSSHLLETPPVERLWKAWLVVLEMITDRKYEVDSDYLMTLEDFQEWLGVVDSAEKDVNLTEIRKELYYRMGTDTKAVCVFWKESLGTTEVQEFIETMESEGVKRGIAVYNNKITPYAAAALRTLRVQGIIIETFCEDELQYNITKHTDVPQHIICSAATKKEVLESYGVEAQHINKLLLSDPVCRYYGAMKGQLIKIVRPSDAIPEVVLPDGTIKKLYDITYRVVT